ncbi:MAG: hypothetical protein J5748_06445 [Bacteroidales bacterium]|nr:hypothetical protein [Bacteroidales bacterium]
MKKNLILLVAAALIFGCTQEQIDDTNNTVIHDESEVVTTPDDGTATVEPKVVSFTAELPEFDGLTKATVDASAFNWTAGDEIAVPVKDGEGVRYVNFQNSAGALTTFTYAVTDEEFVEGTAYYPASSAPGGSYSTTFISIEDAQSKFKMTAPVTLGSSSLTFTHQSSIVHLTFTNVPALATKLVVNDGSDDVAIINFSATGTVVFNVPLTPAGSSKKYTFKLQENSNVLKQVSKTADLIAGKYYNAKTAVPVGRIIRVQDATDWETKALYIWNHDNGAENAFFTTDGSYPNKFNTISANDHYIVIPSSCSWASATTKVGVKFQTVNDSASTQTDGIYPNRDITFNVPAGLGMKTEYRIYPRSSSLTSISTFITKPLHLYVYNKANWENIQIYKWSNKNSSDYIPTAWGSVSWTKVNDGSTSFNGKTCKELSFESNLCGGTPASSGLIVGNLSGEKTGDLHTGWVGDIFVEFDGASSSITEFNDTKRISAAWPGTTINSVTSSINTNAYYSFDVAQYGQEVWVVFSRSGSYQKTTWVFTVNQDYDYNLDL